MTKSDHTATGHQRPGPRPSESREDRARRVSDERLQRQVRAQRVRAAVITANSARPAHQPVIGISAEREVPGPVERRSAQPAQVYEPVIMLGGAANDGERKRAAMVFAAIMATVLALGIIGSVAQRLSDDAVQVSSVDTPEVEVLGADETGGVPATEAPLTQAPSVEPAGVEATAPDLARTTPTTALSRAIITPVASIETSSTTTPPTTIPVADRDLERIDTVVGDIAPKSVTATGTGLFFAQNMMYRHSVTVYDEQGSLLRTIDDRVDLAAFGIEGGVVARGAPVEAAPTSDGSFVYVSNYAMYGPGFGPEPEDGCNDTGWDNSFVYRVGTTDLEIDQVIEVGAVPKFLDVTPDDRLIVVANWCSFDVSIIDVASGVEVSRIDIGRHPRGIAISSDSSTAYVTEQGGTRIAVIDLDLIQPPSFDALADGGSPDWGANVELDWITNVGLAPRSLALSPDDQFLFATLNGDGQVVKIDLDTRTVVAGVRTGDAPRSMAISADGEALYVVNYDSNTMSKILTSDMEEVQELSTADKPIGIAVDPLSSNVWVSNYSGVLQIYEDQ